MLLLSKQKQHQSLCCRVQISLDGLNFIWGGGESCYSEHGRCSLSSKIFHSLTMNYENPVLFKSTLLNEATQT